MENFKDKFAVSLQDGTSVLIESERPVRQKVSSSAKSLAQVMSTVTSLAKEMKESFEVTNSRKTTIEIGLDLTLEAGSLTALVVKGASTANFKDTIEWENSKVERYDSK